MVYNYQSGLVAPFVQKFYKQLVIATGVLFVLTFAMLSLKTNAESTNVVVVPSTTVKVSGDTGSENEKGKWMFNRDPGNVTPYVFNTDEKVIGNGALYILPITNTIKANKDKFIAEYFARDSVANFQSFSYDFKIAGAGKTASEAKQFYANFYITTADNVTYYNCRFDFVPIVGSTSNFTTFAINKTTVASAVINKTCPPSMKLSDLPTAYIRAIAINVGDTDGSDTGLAGYLDNVIYTTQNNKTIYDFDPSVTSKEECKDGGWMLGLADGSTFKNQGNCVSYFAKKSDK